MTSVHEEIEIKYDVGLDFEVPSVVDLVRDVADRGALLQGEPAQHRLEATYFDTADHRLARARLTLRRRTGGDDAGWHLKVPGGGGARLEVRRPLGRSVRTVPVALRRMVRARTGGADLVPVARITTDRSVNRLVDASGRVLLEVADDRVQASRLVAGAPVGATPATSDSWRELEVELVDGDRSLLAAVDGRLRVLGLQVAGSRSKLARVLGDAGAPAVPSRPQLWPESSSGEVMLGYVAGQAEQIRAQDVQVRVDAEDSVHKMRVATRRLRSALRTFRPVFGADVVARLNPELRWLAAELGAARDAEVIRDRLVDALAPEATDAASDPVRRSVAQDLDRTYRAAHTDVLAVLDSDRYHSLLDALQELLDTGAHGPRAERRAADRLPRRAARTYADLRDSVRAARHASENADREECLHEARKGAKRARYAGEALTGVFGRDAARFAAAMEAVQEELGEHQDSVVMRERLRELARRATDPEVAFAYGRLYAQEESRGGRSQERFAEVWRDSSRKSLRRWLR